MIDLQPLLENDKAVLWPLKEEDFEALYAPASDPAVWEQHPNKNRWQKDVFRTYFDGAMQSGGAFKIIDKQSGEVAGSSRFYDYNEEENSIFIGYTFYGTKFWGRGLNQSVKKLMMDYIFRYVSAVYFHVGAGNLRSQIAIGRTGAEKVGELEVAYYGGDNNLNFVYRITKEEWNKRKSD
ncbi:MAG: GNAT family N-acetyltransferase [Ferruginibacter sp.]